jgi:O-acetyl-ADP-ribose deacetylase (regulator of RNase III)
MAGRMTVIRGDITRLTVDAIVNAANEALLPGGGVCGAIHRAAGPGLWEECKRIGRCPPGEAVITGGYALPARYVIHTVGPIWRGGGHGEDETLARCYTNSLALAAEHGIRSIAFPAISTGIYGFPADRAARIAVESVRRYLREHDQPADVRFVVFDNANVAAYAAVLPDGAETVA